MQHERAFSRNYFRRFSPSFGEDGNARGNRNERRALALFRELVDEGIFVRVKRASKKQNMRKGIDMFGVVMAEVDGQLQEVPIPFQIKSSYERVQAFFAQSAGDVRRQTIEVITVNDHRPDRYIKRLICIGVSRFLIQERERGLGLDSDRISAG